MSKYLVVALAAGVSSVSRFRSMKAVKQHVKTAVKANPHDFMVVDNNGNTYVKFVGGKIRKGDPVLYRQFTRRGYVSPVTTAVVEPVQEQEVVLPINATKEQYLEAQEQWIKKNNPQNGDKFIVNRIAFKGEKGWQDAWVDSMDQCVGVESWFSHVNGTLGLNLRLNGRWYNFPFFILQKV